MFGTKPGRFTSITIDEVPALKHAAAEVAKIATRDEDFARRMFLLSTAEKEPDARREQYQWEFMLFIADIVERAEAKNASSDEEILNAYLPLEQARFALTLRGDLLVPLALTALDLSEPFQITEGMWIEPLTEDVQRARAESSAFSRRVPAHVVAAATHAVVIQDVQVSNQNYVRRRWQHQTEIDLTAVDQLVQCLFIATERETGYAQVCMRPHDWTDSWEHDLPPIWKIQTVHQYPERFDEGGWNEPQDPISRQDLQQLPALYAALTAAPPNVHLAARRAFRALTRTDDEDETIDSTIGIEALLLGNNDRDEVTHRMAQRAAVALAAEYDAEAIYRALKGVYAHRSAIVHGRTKRRHLVRVGDADFRAQDLARMLLRFLLLSRLTADEPWSPESLDAELLRSLSRPHEAE